MFFDRLSQEGINTHLIVGNHDIFYKTSLKLNALQLNLREYSNLTIHNQPNTCTVNGVDLFMVPWICQDNAERFVVELEKSRARIALGHLELTGFYANQDYKCQHGTDPDVFNKFDRVFSGHFHKRSARGNIKYLGNAYQLYWNDVNEVRGFHILDLDTGEVEFIKNPTTMFSKILYNEDKQKLFNPRKYKDTFVKIVVEKRSTPHRLTKFVDSLYEVGVHDVKVIDSSELSVDDDVEIEAEDTLTTLTNYVNAMDEQTNKTPIIDIFKSLYVEAQEI